MRSVGPAVLLFGILLAAGAVRGAAENSSGAAPSVPAAKNDAVRQEFIAAWQHPGASGDSDSAALRSFILYDYLVAARLRYAIQTGSGVRVDSAVEAFLSARGNDPVTRPLRHDWLIDLAQRHRWDVFLPRVSETSDPVLQCDRLAGRLESGDTATLGADALTRWILPQSPPRECEVVFDWLRQQNLITLPLVGVRTRAALAAGNPRLARTFALALPPADAAPLLLWAQLLENPAGAVGALAANPTQPVETAALDAGFARLARSDSGAALNLLPRLLARPDTTPDLRERLERNAALGAAYDRSPQALLALESVPDAAASDDVWQWRVRAALWAGRFDRALDWIQRMPPALASQPRWRYWRARAVEAREGMTEAAGLYASLAAERDYYGYLASDRVHRDYSLNARATPDDRQLQSALETKPGLARARALFECNLWDEAAAEWANELADTDASTRIQAARLAERWGWYAQAIATLAQANEWSDVALRYPRPFSEEVARASARAQLPPDWLMAVMRQESLFRSDALSRAGARGLMQLRPGTATAVARRWHLPVPSAEQLSDPQVSLNLGAAYLRELLDRFNGQLGPALAAYNAGNAPVTRWMPASAMDADIWIENIAYGETRDYVQRICEHIVAFAWARNDKPPRLASLLPPVVPPDAPAGPRLSSAGVAMHHQ